MLVFECEAFPITLSNTKEVQSSATKLETFFSIPGWNAHMVFESWKYSFIYIRSCGKFKKELYMIYNGFDPIPTNQISNLLNLKK